MLEEIKRIGGEINSGYRKRFYPKQKERFRAYITDEFKKAGFEDIKQDNSKNIIIGDLDNASEVYAAHYDTPMLSFYLTPFARIFGHLIGTFVSAIVMCLVIVLVPVLISFVFTDNSALFLSIFNVLVLLFLLMHFFPNPNNANDNTSGVLTLILAAMKLKEQQRLEGVAFVLFNNEELGLLGSMKLAKEYKKRNGKAASFMVYNFDCTAIGDTIFIAAKGAEGKSAANAISQAVEQKENKPAKVVTGSLLYGSDYLSFANGVMLSSVNPSYLGPVYLPNVHMPNDKKIDYTCIEKICDYTLSIKEQQA